MRVHFGRLFDRTDADNPDVFVCGFGRDPPRELWSNDYEIERSNACNHSLDVTLQTPYMWQIPRRYVRHNGLRVRQPKV